MKRSIGLVFFVLTLIVPAAYPQSDDFIKAQGYNRTGREKMQKGDLDGAIKDFTAAIETMPKELGGALAGLYVNRSLALVKKGDLDAALADINKSIKIQPNNQYAYQNRADLRRKRGELDEAIEDYNKTIKLNSKFAAAYQWRGLTLLEQGKDAEAQKDFDKSLELDPSLKDSLEKNIQQVKEKRMSKQ
jgi:tetratricopeptide (TPR) repeat protein